MADGYRGLILDLLTVDSSIDTAKTPTINAEADGVIIQADTQNVRVTIDGTTPTASVGFRIPFGSFAEFTMGPNVTIKWIGETAGGKVQWLSYRNLRDTNT